MHSTWLFAAAATSLVATAARAAGLTENVEWAVPSDGEAVRVEAELTAYDTLIFNYDGNAHDVWLLPDRDAFDACDFSAAEEISEEDTPGKTTYTPPDSGDYYLASSKDDDCQKGLRLHINIGEMKSPPTPAAVPTTARDGPPLTGEEEMEFLAAAALGAETRPGSLHVVDWYRPYTIMTELKKTSRVVVGDTIKFWIYDRYGDIFLMPDKESYTECEFDEATKLLQGARQYYDYTVREPGQLYFASLSYCLLGEKLAFIAERMPALNIIAGGLTPTISIPPTASVESMTSPTPVSPSYPSTTTVTTPTSTVPVGTTTTSTSPTTQSMTVLPTSTGSPAPLQSLTLAWERPVSPIDSLPPITFGINSSLLFRYYDVGPDTANVARFRTLDELNRCDFSRVIVMNQQRGPYRLLFQSAGSFYFGSTINDHCAQGLRQVVTIPKPLSNAPVTLKGTVYNDWNNNAKAESGEGLADVPISITGNGIVPRTLLTDANGFYEVNDLAPGTYEVAVGNIPNFDIADSPTRRRTYTLAGGESATFDFRVIGPAPTAPATIFGHIYNDENENKNFDSGEGISGVSVQLNNTAGTVIQTATTDSNGQYTFSVEPGAYVVVISNITGYEVEGLPVTKDVTATGGARVQFDYHVSGPKPGTPATIQGIVYHDKDENQTPDSGEGIAGVLITLTNMAGMMRRTTTTNTTGGYSFSVDPSTYRVNVGDIPGFPIPATVDKSKIIVAKAGTINNYNYAVTGTSPTAPGSVSGYVWWDANNSTVRESTDGLADVDVSLSSGVEGVLGTTKTNATGGFAFASLPAGEYTVTFGSIPGFTFDQGSQVRDVTLSPGQDYVLDYRITGERGSLDPNGYINGSIYNDRNNNEMADRGEGIANVLVTVQNSPSRSVVQTAYTDSNGNYNFTVPPGEYFVVLGDLPGATVSIEDRTRQLTVVNGHTVPFNFRLTNPDSSTPGRVIGTIYSDYNNNNKADSDEGIEGVAVEIRTPGGEFVANTATDSLGQFSVTVAPGNYRVTLGQFPNVNVPISYRVKDIQVPAGGAGSYIFRLTGLPRPTA